MFRPHLSTLVVAALVSAAAAASSVTRLSASSGGSTLDTRSRFGSPSSGGTASISGSSVNGRPVSVTGFTTGTGHNSFSSGTLGNRGGFSSGTLGNRGGFSSGTLGNRGGFTNVRLPQIQPIRPIRPLVFPQIRPFTRFYPTGTSTRFGRPSYSQNSYIDTDGFFNSIANDINRSFRRGY